MTMITPSYLGETIEYSSLHACRSTLEDPTFHGCAGIFPVRTLFWQALLLLVLFRRRGVAAERVLLLTALLVLSLVRMS